MQREERDADNGIKAGIICLLFFPLLLSALVISSSRLLLKWALVTMDISGGSSAPLDGAR